MKKWRNICYISRNNVRATSEWFNKLIAERPGIVERSEVNPDDNPLLEQQVKSVKERKSIVLIMKSGNKVAAKIDIEPLHREVDKRVGEVSFGVLEGFDNESVELVREACKKAKTFGLRILVYYILGGNKRFISVMEKAGFKKAGIIGKFYRINGRYYDRIILEKVL